MKTLNVQSVTTHTAYQVAAKFTGYNKPEFSPEAKAFAVGKTVALVKVVTKHANNFEYIGLGTPTPRGNKTYKWTNKALNLAIIVESGQIVTAYPIIPTKWWDGRSFTPDYELQ